MSDDIKTILRALPWYLFAVMFCFAFYQHDAYAMAFSGTLLVVSTIQGYPMRVTHSESRD